MDADHVYASLLQLAWAAFGFWGIIFGFAFSGGKKEESKAAA